MTQPASAAEQVFHEHGGAGIERVQPFLKWAGGKRWAIKKIAELAPKEFDRYIEPFLGGGSVFFSLAPKHALLSDVNPELITAYQQIRDNSAEIERCLAWLQRRHGKDLYYAVRSKEFSHSTLRAAKFIYLNRTCWNGLYRVNRLGQFNVPMGTKTKVEFESSLSLYASALRDAEVMCSDFETVLGKATKGDFVFVDPPYTVKHNNNGFLKYNEQIFSWLDQERLAGAVRAASVRGASVLVSNADHQSIRDLFSPLGDVISLERSSVIAGSSGNYILYLAPIL